MVAGGLDPKKCDLTKGYGAAASISHVPSGSVFILDDNVLPYTGKYVVGNSELVRPYQAFTWTQVRETVRRWAEEVKRDVDTLDLWAELQREPEILTGARYEAAENTPFTPNEQAEIAKQLREIKEDGAKQVCKLFPLTDLPTSSRPGNARMIAHRGPIVSSATIRRALSRASSQSAGRNSHPHRG